MYNVLTGQASEIKNEKLKKDLLMKDYNATKDLLNLSLWL